MVVFDGVARGGTGSVVVSWCVCLCMASVASVARGKIAVGSTRQKKTGWGPSKIRER